MDRYDNVFRYAECISNLPEEIVADIHEYRRKKMSGRVDDWEKEDLVYKIASFCWMKKDKKVLIEYSLKFKEEDELNDSKTKENIFVVLLELFEKLESTTSKIEKNIIYAKGFKKTYDWDVVKQILDECINSKLITSQEEIQAREMLADIYDFNDEKDKR